MKRLNEIWQDRQLRLVILAALLAVCFYVLAALLSGGAGFPLDDGWIHQTYARNLARTGRWEYVPGVISAGSTSPLWTLWLAVGYLLRIPHLFWAYLSGALSLVWVCLMGIKLWQHLWPEQADRGWLIGLLMVGLWPLVWAAGSGMETVLFIALGLQAIYAYYQVGTTEWGAVKVGLWAGCLILVRPDGLPLLLLLTIGLLAGNRDLRRKQQFRNVAICLLGAAIPLVPYFLFNRWASGQWWPNTFYAKQSEYQVLLEEVLAGRFFRLLYFSLGGPETGWRGISGAHLLLVPGIIGAGLMAVRRDLEQRRFFYTIPLLWAGGHVLLYAWRLPVTFQHGRYLMAALPVWTLFGIAGWLPIVAAARQRFGALWSRSLSMIYAAMVLVFFLLGLQAYVTDVAFIEGEMVRVALWLNENTPADSVIAAHDIGAIGYFTERDLVDMAGLITPELVPFLTDELSFLGYLRNRGPHYLVTAPGWPYNTIVQISGAQTVYRTNYVWTIEQGLNNMTVYQFLEAEP